MAVGLRADDTGEGLELRGHKQMAMGPLLSVSIKQTIPDGQVIPPAQSSAHTLPAEISRHVVLTLSEGETPHDVGSCAGLQKSVHTPSVSSSLSMQTRPSLQSALPRQCDHHPLTGCGG
jgi:hypothetical protein